jgi:hypothetical protein
MAVLQKNVLDVRLLGLDEKANRRASIAGTIVDGGNWTMNKDGTVEKRPGLSALAMLDTSGASVTEGRELASLNDELVLSNGRKLYSREPSTGKWITKGNSAIERLDINSVLATEYVCNGVDSRLSMDTAQIGRYLLTVAAGKDDAGASKAGWVLTDSTTGEILTPWASTNGFADGWSVGTDGHTAAPSFVAFLWLNGSIRAYVWSPSNGFRTVDSMTALLNTGNSTAVDPNQYTLTHPLTPAPFAVQLIGDGVWLLAQQTTDGLLNVYRVTLTAGTWAVSAPVNVATINTVNAASIAWAYNPGAATAHVVTCGSTTYPFDLYYAEITCATGALVAARTYVEPSSWSGTHRCRGVTGFSLGAIPFFFFDVEHVTAPSERAVWMWTPGSADVTCVLKDSGLASHAFQTRLHDADEIDLTICNQSTWQPSAFVIRLHVSGASWTSFSIGAFLHNGDYAGRPMVQRLPHFAFGSALALGVYNNPISLGGPGTVLLKMATLTSGKDPSVDNLAPVSASAPCQIADTLLLPGAVLKAYDGAHVTEAIFLLGPETITAVESAKGKKFTAQTSSTELTTGNPPANASTYTQSGLEVIFETSAADTPAAPWPAGTVTLDFWAKIVNPSSGATYLLDRGYGSETLKLLSSPGQLTYQASTLSPLSLTANWQHLTYDVPVKLVNTQAGDVLEIDLQATSSLAGDTAILAIAVGGSMAPTFTTPWPVIEAGTREYCAVAKWSDSKGRIQRSQVCPSVSQSNAGGRANAVTVAMANITERDPLTNIDPRISSAEIEIYRTAVSSTIFYLVGSVKNVVNGDDVVFMDYSPDTDITANEQLYTTGNVVGNWPPIGCNLVASHQGRIFAATAAGEVFFSAYAQGGEGLSFASEYQIETEHIGRNLTALLSLDTTLVIATANSYATLTGIGPESNGTPSYDTPSLFGSGVGPYSQRTCARIPEGIVMPTAHGVQLLDRGLSLENIGQQVVDSMPGGLNWYSSAYHPTKHQARLFGNSSTIIYDWTLAAPSGRTAQFMKWQYAADIRASAVAAGVLYVLGSDGVAYASDVGYSDGANPYGEWIHLSVISPNGPNAWGRVYAMRLACNLVASGVLKVGFNPEEGNLGSSDYTTITAGVNGLQHVVAKPMRGRCSSMTIYIGESAASSTYGFVLNAIGLLVGNLGGLGRLPVSNRMTRSAT